MSRLYWIEITLLFSIVTGVRCLRDTRLEILPEIVELGGETTLRCHYDLENEKLYTLKWYRGKDEFYRFTPGAKSPIKSFTLKGITVERSKSDERQVTITDVDYNVTGNYSCEVTTDDPFTTEADYNRIVVVSLPQGRPVIAAEKERYELGETLKANCTVPPSKPRATLSFTLNNKPVSAKRKCNIEMAKSIFKELDMMDDNENEDESNSEKSCAFGPEIHERIDEQDLREKDEDNTSIAASVDSLDVSECNLDPTKAEAHQGKKDSEKLALVLAGQREKKSNVGHLTELRQTLLKAQHLVDEMLSRNVFDSEGSAELNDEKEEVTLSDDENDETRNRQRSPSPNLHFTQKSRSSPLPAKAFEEASASRPVVGGQTTANRVQFAKSVTSYSELLEQEDNSWTLRYTKEEDKTIEIMPGTGIYVLKIELANINRKAKGQTQMARQLLDAIFTREALRTCTLCGKKPKGLGKGDTRPALHQEAKTVLLEYVQQTADKLKWPPVADQLIMQSLRGKLNEIKDTEKLNKN